MSSLSLVINDVDVVVAVVVIVAVVVVAGVVTAVHALSS